MYAAGSSTRYAPPRVIFARCLENLLGETTIEWEFIRDHRKSHLPFGEILVNLHENVNSRIRLIFRRVILHEDNGLCYCLDHFVWIQKTRISIKSFVEFHLQTTLSEKATNFPIAGKRSTKMLICFWTSASPPCSVCFNSALFKSMNAFWSDLKALREAMIKMRKFLSLGLSHLIFPQNDIKTLNWVLSGTASQIFNPLWKWYLAKSSWKHCSMSANTSNMFLSASIARTLDLYREFEHGP